MFYFNKPHIEIHINMHKNKICTENSMDEAVKIIKDGGVVAFPTETVYGLGANALNKKAVSKIFVIKKRPLGNPLIVHISDVSELPKLVKHIPKIADILSRKFWPGSLTLVFLKNQLIPDNVVANGNTVAIRIPKNKTALDLIRKSGVPIAAPSANLAGSPSSTTAQHVFDDFGKKVFILDGGDCEIGLESTVLDLTSEIPTILRYGDVSFTDLKKEIGKVQIHPSLLGKKQRNSVKTTPKSPGMKYRHYAPKADLLLVEKNKINDLIKKYKKQGKNIGVMTTSELKNNYPEAYVVLSIGSIKTPKIIAKNLFSVLRNFNNFNVDIILSKNFTEKEVGAAIIDRLQRASKKR